MTNPVELTAHDPIIDKLNFKSYKSTVERRFERFTPEPGEPRRDLEGSGEAGSARQR